MKINLKIILGSTRQNRFGDKPATWVYEVAKNRPGLSIELLDLRNYPLPFFDSPILPSMRTEVYSNETARTWVQKIDAADAYIIVSPEYNHGYPAVLKNALDYPYKEWNNKPVGFVSYGSTSGARAIEQLRLVAVTLQMAPIRESVLIPWSAMAPVVMGQVEWDPTALDPSLQGSPDKLLDQLIWWAMALKTAREHKEIIA